MTAPSFFAMLENVKRDLSLAHQAGAADGPSADETELEAWRQLGSSVNTLLQALRARSE